MAANQTECSRLEQRSVIKFLVAENVKSTEECVICTEKHVLFQKVFTIGLIGCHDVSELKRQPME